MPELPEVETTRRGIEPHLVGRRFERVIVRDRRLRFGVDAAVERELPGRRVLAVERRAKYLLVRVDGGTLVLHLGMSGSLRSLARDEAPRKHDHLDFVLDDGSVLRFHDPRRFGCALFTTADPSRLSLLASLGVEPLEGGFDGAYLAAKAKRRPGTVKAFLMDAKVVAGVGNIYANEALFAAGVHPHRAANRVALARYETLAASVRVVLQRALRAGGTTLRDYRNGDGEPGRFRLRLAVYEREGLPCRRCGEPIRLSRRFQRATYFCPGCQR